MDEAQYQEVLLALRIAHMADEIDEPLRTFVKKARLAGIDDHVIADDLHLMAIYVRHGLEVGLYKNRQLLHAEDMGVPREMVRRALVEISGYKPAKPAAALRTALSRGRAEWSDGTSADSNVPQDLREQVLAEVEAHWARIEARHDVSKNAVEGAPLTPAAAPQG